VPWNRPLYEHLGFSVLEEEELNRDFVLSGTMRRLMAWA
jgi:hypothetical protein